MKKPSKALSVLWSSTLALFAVSASIFVPIFWRGFYYLHIDALHLSEVTGWSYEEIRAAFDDMMDYEWRGADFATGILKWSEEGKKHFADCKVLFHFDAAVLVVTAVLLLLLFLLRRRGIRPYHFRHKAPSFFAGIGTIAFFGIVTVLGAIDFDRAFTVFHRMFFPGKTNWLFDYRTDEIILILPQVYFRNCAIVAIVLIAICCIIYIVAGLQSSSSSSSSS